MRRRVDVDGDRVAVAHGGDRPAARRLGGDVAGHEAVRGAGEAPVGEQRDVLAEALAVDRRGDREHLAHAGAADRALVADDDDVAGLDPPGGDRVHRGLLALEHARRALVVAALVARELHDAAVGREVAAQDRQAAGGLERVARAAARPPGRGSRRASSACSPIVLPVDGRRVRVQQAGLEQALGEHRRRRRRRRGRRRRSGRPA